MKHGTDAERDKRITDEVIVDAYGPEEQALGWYYYLERKMTFPVAMRCIEVQSVSPLEEAEEVHVVGMTDEEDCMCEMFVRVEWMDREFGVPLIQLEVVDAESDTQEAVADWHYWFGDGGRLC
ncbi:calcium binding protein [Natrinema hispanicum]|uniref:Calcium binding protein n=1 Tax=Natrinema hispanicum TaxID=392421 RepID=A0A482YDK7_9EURY|nr:calcium-binding protein [Natrinema hispanicum]RZV10869.1 calcium binding protein [Natrinema hispanicum]